MYYNRAIIVGNLTRDPELRSLPSGVQLTTIGVATNRVWKDKDGERQESTDYHNVVVFGRQAETTAQYLRKGSSVLVEGRMQTRSWEGADGIKKYRTEIIADRIQFGPRKDNNVPAATNEAKKDSSKKTPPEGAIEYPEDSVNVEDIPF